MKKSGLPILLLFTAALLFTPFASLAQLLVNGTAVFEVAGPGAKVTVLVPLKMDNIADFQALTVTTNAFSVRNGKSTPPRFAHGVTVQKDTGQARLIVTVNTDSLNQQGDYDVNIAYSTDKKKTQLLNFTLNRPPAVLESLNTLTINKVGAKTIQNVVAVRENGNRSAAEGLKATGIYIENAKKDGLVAFDSLAYRIAPGAAGNLSYTIDPQLLNALPLGESKGSLQLNAPTMAAAVRVNIDIWRRQDKRLIIVFVFLGLLTGLFVRHYLKDQKDAGQARLDGFQLVQQMETDLTVIADHAYRKKIDPVIQTLKAALAQKYAILPGDPVKISKAVQDAAVAYTAAKNDFAAKISGLSDQYTQLANAVFSRQWLPSLTLRLGNTRLRL